MSYCYLTLRTSTLLGVFCCLVACQSTPTKIPASSDKPVSYRQKATPPPPTVRPGAAPQHERDGGPPIPHDVSQIPDAIPRVEARSAYGNYSPYTVLGKSYKVMKEKDAYRYDEKGTASWYGTKFHGRLTSNREVYDMYGMTAAHKTLPLPSYVQVTNMENGRHVIVRVNDRGPFHDKRIIDLSYAAAAKLGIHSQGTGRVRVKAVQPGEYIAENIKEPALSLHTYSPTTTLVSPPVYIIQVGAYASKENATHLVQKLQKAFINDAYIDRVKTNRGLLHRVRIGPLKTQDDIDAMLARITHLGIQNARVLLNS